MPYCIHFMHFKFVFIAGVFIGIVSLDSCSSFVSRLQKEVQKVYYFNIDRKNLKNLKLLWKIHEQLVGFIMLQRLLWKWFRPFHLWERYQCRCICDLLKTRKEQDQKTYPGSPFLVLNKALSWAAQITALTAPAPWGLTAHSKQISKAHTSVHTGSLHSGKNAFSFGKAVRLDMKYYINYPISE